jgi:hypothetical protein
LTTGTRFPTRTPTRTRHRARSPTRTRMDGGKRYVFDHRKVDAHRNADDSGEYEYEYRCAKYEYEYE